MNIFTNRSNNRCFLTFESEQTYVDEKKEHCEMPIEIYEDLYGQKETEGRYEL